MARATKVLYVVHTLKLSSPLLKHEFVFQLAVGERIDSHTLSVTVRGL
jgi:hypothetical protein